MAGRESEVEGDGQWGSIVGAGAVGERRRWNRRKKIGAF